MMYKSVYIFYIGQLIIVMPLKLFNILCVLTSSNLQL